MHDIEKEKWCTDVKEISKLDFNNLCKTECKAECFLWKVNNGQHRSLLAQLRCGVLPLKLETGRYLNIPRDLRLCVLCSANSIESEVHFLLHCFKYQEIRTAFYNNVSSVFPHYLCVIQIKSNC